MNEIGEFFVEITSKGFAEIKEKLDDLTRRLDSLDGGFKKASKASDSFIGGFKKWAKGIGLVWAMHKALSETFKVANKIQDVYKSADILGVDAATLEKWTLVAELHKGNQGDVTSFFSGLNEMARNLREGKYSPDLMERMARYGFTEQYMYGASLPQNRDKLIGDLNRLLNRKDLDAADIQALQSVFPGLNDTMVSILKSLPKDLAAELAWADRNRRLTNDPQALRDATAIGKAKIELRNAFEDAFKPLQEPLGNLIDSLKPLAVPLAELVKAIAILITMLMPFVNWVVKVFGGSLAMMFEGVAAGLKSILTLSMAPIREWNDKYLQEGKGGGLGWLYRGFDEGQEAVGNELANLMFGNPNDIVLDLDSLPTSNTATPATTQSPKLTADLNARIDLFNNGVPAEQIRWGTYVDPRTGQELGTAAWATSVQ